MTNSDPSHRPVDVLGLVTLESPAGRVDVEGMGASIHVTARGAGSSRAWIGSLLRAGGAARRASFARLARLAAFADVDVSFRLGPSEIARLRGADRGGWLSRRLGFPGLRIRKFAAMRALIGRIES